MEMSALADLPATWLELTLKRRKISWGVFVLVLCIFLLAIELPYSLRADVDNLFGIAIYDFVIEGYALSAWAVIRYYLVIALISIHPLVDQPVESGRFSHREWQISFGIGIPLTIALVATNPVISGTLNDVRTWLYILSQLIESVVLGWIVFAMLASTNQITIFLSKASKTNIFDATPFRPVAHWCLSVTVSVMGAITIATLFLGEDLYNTFNLITYVIAGLLGVFIFFAGMWGTHQHMLKHKEREISRINQELLSLHGEIMSKVNNRDMDASRILIEASTALENHRSQVEKTAEWPYTMGNLGGLATSVTVPVIVNFLGKFF